MMGMFLLSLLYLLSPSFAFVAPTTKITTTTTTTVKQYYPRFPSFSSSSTDRLFASSSSSDDELFKAGLLADETSKELAVKLASTRIRKISDLGWKEIKQTSSNNNNNQRRRKSSIRPKYWSFGGSKELALQDKSNYSLDNPNCPEPWLGLQDFQLLIGDDTAAADIIFVSLAGGRAFVERDVAESVLDQWWDNDSDGDRGAAQKRSQRQKQQQFDRAAFEQTVKVGQRDFIASWSIFIAIVGLCGAGIVFPNNPFQLVLVDALDRVF
mmetsp:Transcript_1306/g.1458  ORF Transcript_1306/g.1458 Transcript_1306/m.1458 type:complete len:268 (-) Transcript_1306:47-850(-)